MFSQSTLNQRTLTFVGALSLAATFLPLSTQAQLGVSPSQNAAFLTELRARDPKRADENRDVLGDAREKLETGRALSRPEVFSSSVTNPRRLNADLTGFPSQYQLGRSYLSPWYDGVVAPENTLQNASGISAGFAFEQGFEYNSVIKNGKGGVILSSTLLFDTQYKLAENQRLTLTGGLGFNWVSGNDRIDWSFFSDEFGLAVLPGTSLAYDAQFGPISLTIYDRVSVRPYLGVLQNDLGIAGTWQIAPALSWTLNYTHSTTHDVDGNYLGAVLPVADLDTFSSVLNFDINGALSVGLEGALNWLDHDNDEVANDGTLWNLGAYVAWKINDKSRLRVAAGYQHQEYDNTSLFANIPPFFVVPNDSSDLSEPYYSISFSQRLSDHLSHEFAAGYESNLDFGSNFTSSHYVNYGLTTDTWKGGRITASGFVEHSDQSAAFNSGRFTSFGLDLHLAQQITSKLIAGLGYSYVRIETDISNRVSNTGTKFNQHMFGLNLSYALNAKMQVNLGYQSFLFTQSGLATRDNHRVMLGLRYQF
ncbi:TonB-dependent receptor [Prosthecobacter dejongeii]|uniref:Opacity protein-like surface antigen n=1 Tax=Prosthecobacter dejongeii TaxID=48465 RepID=A0A7W7YP25_9BACT|nr:TonB-dependent receptor [Prosthecobacter dejongeii]MBB5039746.1 opacity protein-like surface antigen [Prosthecobacter dejongeii]